MTTSELPDFVEHFFVEVLETIKDKNKDYSGEGSDAFRNFKRCETYGIKAEVGMFVRLLDKVGRLSSFLEKGELAVKDEAVEDTLKDLAGYTAILAAFLASKKQKVYYSPHKH